MDAKKFAPAILFLALSMTLAVSQQLCQQTNHAPLCSSIVEAGPRTNLKNSFKGIGTILTDKAVATADTTTTKISSLLGTITDSKIVASLKGCAQGYAIATSRLRAVDFGHFHYITLLGDIDNASDVPHECKASFGEPGPVASPISVDLQSLIDICDTIRDVIYLRQCNKLSPC